MAKMNKKGFTLIEMLVVIAIIAVLVSIIIPTVTSATDKAEAAANAANLRSLKAEIVTAMLTDDTTSPWGTIDAPAAGEDGAVTTTTVTIDGDKLAAVKKVFGAETTAADFTLTVDSNSNVTVTYKGSDIDTWAGKAK